MVVVRSVMLVGMHGNLGTMHAVRGVLPCLNGDMEVPQGG
jgi:hypothetical protein